MRPIPVTLLPIVLAACAPADDSGDNSAGTAAESDAGVETVTTTEPAKAPDLERTAWRVLGQDGAVYITFLDADGLYRDLRNGDPWRNGNWLRDDAGKLCFTPADEALTGECWKLKKPNTNGVMRASNDADKTIKLQQVTYVAPDDAPNDVEQAE